MSKNVKRILGLDENNIIIYERYGTYLYEDKGEIEDYDGQVGQKIISKGIYEDVEVAHEEELSLEDKINFLYYSKMGVI